MCWQNVCNFYQYPICNRPHLAKLRPGMYITRTVSKTPVSYGLMILSFAITLAALFYRRPDAFYASQFWGEEGSVFYSDAFHQGWNSLFNTCVGYFHLYPRLIACITTALKLPVHYVPAVFCYSWLFVLFILQLYIWMRLPFSAVQRFFISITVVLIPLQSEVFMNLTNVQWILALFPVIIFSSDTKSKKWFIADLLVLLLSGMTGPNFTVLFPLFILIFIFKRKEFFAEKSKLVLLILAICFAIAGALALKNYGSINRTAGEFQLTNKGFVQLVFVQYAFLFIGKFAFKIPFLLMTIGVLLLIAVFIWQIRKIRRKKQNTFELVALSAGLLYLLTTLVAYRYDPGLLSPYYRGVRNFYIPAVMFIWILIRLADEHKFEKTILGGLMILFSVQTILFVGQLKFVQYDLSHYNTKLQTSDTLSIPINPESWYIHLDKSKVK